MPIAWVDVLPTPAEVSSDVPSGAHARRQYGALPFRIAATGGVEVLLVTSRTTRRWVIPKGWPMKGVKPSQAAAREAFEEAGVRGKIASEPIGTYFYRKRADDHKNPAAVCRVAVYALRVKRQVNRWPERGQRQTCWLTAQEAAARIEDVGLRAIIETLATSRCKSRTAVVEVGTRSATSPAPRPDVSPAEGISLADTPPWRTGGRRRPTAAGS